MKVKMKKMKKKRFIYSSIFDFFRTYLFVCINHNECSVKSLEIYILLLLVEYMKQSSKQLNSSQLIAVTIGVNDRDTKCPFLQTVRRARTDQRLSRTYAFLHPGVGKSRKNRYRVNEGWSNERHQYTICGCLK